MQELYGAEIWTRPSVGGSRTALNSIIMSSTEYCNILVPFFSRSVLSSLYNHWRIIVLLLVCIYLIDGQNCSLVKPKLSNLRAECTWILWYHCMLWQNIGRNVTTATTYIIIAHVGVSSTWSTAACNNKGDISDIYIQFYQKIMTIS